MSAAQNLKAQRARIPCTIGSRVVDDSSELVKLGTIGAGGLVPTSNVRLASPLPQPFRSHCRRIKVCTWLTALLRHEPRQEPHPVVPRKADRVGEDLLQVQ